MRYCIVCKRPMYTSLESIWIEGTNYDIHVSCKKDFELEAKDND